MTKQKLIDWIVYALVVAVSIAAVVLVYLSLSFAIDTKVLYQGF
jgi:hypothetical protein